MLIDKIKSINPFKLLWLVTLFLFIASLVLVNLTDSEGGYQPWRSVSINLFLVNILLGVIAFLLMLVSFTSDFKNAQKYRKIRIFKFLRRYSFIAIVVYALVHSAVFAVAGYDSNKQRNIEAAALNKSTVLQNNQSADAIALPTSTITPVLKKIQPVYVDPDPVESCTSTYPNCNGQIIKVKRSACSKITCCQVGDEWSVYPSSDQCKKDQDAANKQITGTYTPPTTNTYATPSYPPCVVYYPGLGYSKTYDYTSPETCKVWQDSANAVSKNTYQATAAPIPYPTVDQTAQLRISRCKSNCISTVDTYMAQLRTNCMAGGTCDNLTSNPRDARISQCQSQCR